MKIGDIVTWNQVCTDFGGRSPTKGSGVVTRIDGESVLVKIKTPESWRVHSWFFHKDRLIVFKPHVCRVVCKECLKEARQSVMF